MDKKQLNQLRYAMVTLQKGDVDALEVIYNLTRKGVFTFVLPIMGSLEKAEDITQTTYIHVYEKIDMFDEKKNPLNWILTIAKNLALSEIKKEGREISTDWEDSSNKNYCFTYDSNEFDTPTIDLANQILSKEELQIVLLYTVAEYKHREIAEILSLPIGTVTWKYSTAIKKLRKALDEK